MSSTQPLVLVIDDDPDIGRALSDLLAHSGFRVQAVKTGAEGISAVYHESVSVAIVDLGLRDTDGFTVLRAFKQIDSGLPVIVLTAIGQSEIKRRCLEAGAYAFLSKPYSNTVIKGQVVAAAAWRDVARKLRQFDAALMVDEPKLQQALLNLIPGMFWYKDDQNRIVRLNTLAARSIGRTIEQVEGQSTYELYPGEAEKYYRDDRAVIDSGEPKLGIVERYPMAAGELRWVQTDKLPYRDASGRVIGVLVFAEDISGRMPDDSMAREREVPARPVSGNL